MGACCCRPQTAVTEDPNVLMHTKIGSRVKTGMYRTCMQDITQYSAFGGLAYVRDGYLFLESTIGSRFCCFCFRDVWSLANIRDVQAVSGNISVTRRDKYGTHRSTHQMNPGLQITLNNNHRIVVQMPDAVNFCAKLRQCCNVESSNGNPQLLENTVLLVHTRPSTCISAPPAYTAPHMSTHSGTLLGHSKAGEKQPLLN